MNAALAYDPATPLEDELLTLRADDVKIGDTIVQPEAIPLRVTDVRGPLSGWVIVSYECTAGSGKRSMVAGALVNVLRSTKQEAH